MNTFEAISHIRRQSLDRSQAMRYLIEHLGFSATYADEILTVVFAEGDVDHSRNNGNFASG
jgi:hypothetical protein